MAACVPVKDTRDGLSTVTYLELGSEHSGRDHVDDSCGRVLFQHREQAPGKPVKP